jgi:hypothetical protein
LRSAAGTMGILRVLARSVLWTSILYALMDTSFVAGNCLAGNVSG